MRKASQTRLAGMVGAMARPTTLREKRSSTTAKYSQPAPVITGQSFAKLAAYDALPKLHVYRPPGTEPDEAELLGQQVVFNHDARNNGFMTIGIQ